MKFCQIYEGKIEREKTKVEFRFKSKARREAKNSQNMLGKELYRVIQSYIELYRVIQSYIELYRVIQSYIELYNL